LHLGWRAVAAPQQLEIEAVIEAMTTMTSQFFSNR